MRTVRIGAGAGFAGDRLEPAIDLVKRGKLDFLVLECLAERTIALAQLRRIGGSQPGYDLLLEVRLTELLPLCHKHGVRLISNMGAADPKGAARKTIELARSLGLHGLRVACIEGDDVLASVSQLSCFESDPLPKPETLISANAYLGAEPIVAALQKDADIILTGRVADPSLFVAPLAYSFGWEKNDWLRMGRGVLIGHLLECGGQLTGGYFADPGYKDVPDLDQLGFPLAEVDEQGNAMLSKLENTGGLLNLQTCREQLLYEVQDPSAYITPDVVADFTQVDFTQVANDRVSVANGRGTPRPSRYKVSLGSRNGYFGEGQISYGGPGAVPRARLAESILRKRLSDVSRLQIDLMGINSLHGDASPACGDPYEVRLRCVGAFATVTDAERLMREVESLYVNGPAGGGGVTTSLRESVAIDSALIAREAMKWHVTMETA